MMHLDWTAIIVAIVHGGPGIVAAIGIWFYQHPRLKRIERASNGQLATRDIEIARLVSEIARLSQPPPPPP